MEITYKNIDGNTTETDVGYNNLLTKDNTQNLEGDANVDATNEVDLTSGINIGNSEAVLGSGSVPFSATTMQVLNPGDNMQSSNFKTGVSGWRILGNGNVEFATGTFRGAINATSGTIANWTINTNNLSTGNFDTLNTMYFGSYGLSLSNTFKVNADGSLHAKSGTIGSTRITPTELYGGIIKTSETVGIGSTGVIMDTNGLRGYDSILGETFNLPTNGDKPAFSSGIINSTIFEIQTNSILRTSETAGDGSQDSAGILINDTGIYGCAMYQTPSTANFRILNTGSGSIVLGTTGYLRSADMTDFATGSGFYLGYSSTAYKFSVGTTTNYLRWDGSFLKIIGSFEVGSNGIINNSVYTVANLPIPPTSTTFNNPSGIE